MEKRPPFAQFLDGGGSTSFHKARLQWDRDKADCNQADLLHSNHAGVPKQRGMPAWSAASARGMSLPGSCGRFCPLAESEATPLRRAGLLCQREENDHQHAETEKKRVGLNIPALNAAEGIAGIGRQ